MSFYIPCWKKNYTVLGWDLKFFDGLLTLPDWFLAAEVNLCVVEDIKLASEEILEKSREMYSDILIHPRDVVQASIKERLCGLCESVLLCVCRKT